MLDETLSDGRAKKFPVFAHSQFMRSVAWYSATKNGMTAHLDRRVTTPLVKDVMTGVVAIHVG